MGMAETPKWESSREMPIGRRAPSGTRTPNPLIKSQLLCHLS